jgi:hypothetical protein
MSSSRASEAGAAADDGTAQAEATKVRTATVRSRLAKPERECEAMMLLGVRMCVGMLLCRSNMRWLLR